MVKFHCFSPFIYMPNSLIFSAIKSMPRASSSVYLSQRSLFQISTRVDTPMTTDSFSSLAWSLRFAGIRIRPWLSKDVSAAPAKKKRTKALASRFVSGRSLSFSSMRFHSSFGYTKRLWSRPLVMTKDCPSSSLNFVGTIKRPFVSIV